MGLFETHLLITLQKVHIKSILKKCLFIYDLCGDFSHDQK